MKEVIDPRQISRAGRIALDMALPKDGGYRHAEIKPTAEVISNMARTFNLNLTGIDPSVLEAFRAMYKSRYPDENFTTLLGDPDTDRTLLRAFNYDQSTIAEQTSDTQMILDLNHKVKTLYTMTSCVVHDLNKLQANTTPQDFCQSMEIAKRASIIQLDEFRGQIDIMELAQTAHEIVEATRIVLALNEAQQTVLRDTVVRDSQVINSLLRITTPFLDPEANAVFS